MLGRAQVLCSNARPASVVQHQPHLRCIGQVECRLGKQGASRSDRSTAQSLSVLRGLHKTFRQLVEMTQCGLCEFYLFASRVFGFAKHDPSLVAH
jgi:hypothetical protein